MGLVKCCVPNCEDRSSARHRFPIFDEAVYDIWVKRINPDIGLLDPRKVYNSRYVCDRHFSIECHIPQSKKLKKRSLPTKFLPEYKENTSTDNCFPSQDELASFLVKHTAECIIATDLKVSERPLHIQPPDVAQEVQVITVENSPIQKNPDQQTTANFSEVCRACLVQNSNMKSVFSVEAIMEQQVALSDVLMSFTSLQVFQGDGLPDQVCIQCAEEMNRAFLFKKLCEKSDATLRHCIRTLLPLPVNTDLNSCFLKNEDKVQVEELNVMSPKNEEDDEDDKLDIDATFNEGSLDESDEADDNTYEQKKKVRKKKCKLEETEHKRKVYPCKECDSLCLGLGEYRRHMAATHGQIYKCDTCGKEFRSETILTRHLLSHNTLENDENHETAARKIKPYRNKTGITKKRNLPRTCNICNKTFRFHSNLERHKLIHTGEKPYLCNVCGKGFAQLSYLKIHSFIHTGEKPYQCKMCEKSFAAPGTLMTHIRTHTGERPHVCKICGKDFPQSGYLSAHIRTHTGEKPVECKVCHRRFNQSGRLIIHMRIHSGEKPYSCVECGRSFAVKGTLKKHIRTHTGERPYICSVCGQAFAQSGTLATHMKVHKPK